MPVSVSPKTIKQGLETLNELATAAGRALPFLDTWGVRHLLPSIAELPRLIAV